MKRFLLLTVVTLLFAPLHAKDGDQITLQSGTANVIWTLNSAYFETDWSEAKVEGVSWDQWLESKGPDYVRDWPSDKRKIEEYENLSDFIENNKSMRTWLRNHKINLRELTDKPYKKNEVGVNKEGKQINKEKRQQELLLKYMRKKLIY